MNATRFCGTLLLAALWAAAAPTAAGQTFTFTAPGNFFQVNASGVNPTITVTQGVACTLTINTPGNHPMYISVLPTVGPNYYNQCPTCFSSPLLSSPQSSGTVQFTPSTVGTLFYVCAVHAFAGQINVVAAPSPPPSVTTQSASLTLHSSASLNGLVNPNGVATTAYFDFGATTNFGSRTAVTNLGAGSTPVAVSAALNNLSPNTTYFYRAVGSNSVAKVNGSALSFVVPAPPGITDISSQPDGTFLLEFQGATGMNYTLQSSSNLVDWSTLTNLFGGGSGQFNFLDTDATNHSERFYRLRNP
jgi:hypothetical protein